VRRPLEGVTVVALEQVIAGPFCTRQLAELGARVIKIERPGVGDQARSMDRTVQGLSSHFVWTNRSKESLALDVKHPQAKPILAKLVERADVFVQNLAPGAAERLGLGAAELRARHPRLVWCGISGYGPAGPYADKRAYDLLVQCEAGLLSVTGTPEAPAKAGIPVADIAAGMYAMSSILAALLRRERETIWVAAACRCWATSVKPTPKPTARAATFASPNRNNMTPPPRRRSFCPVCTG
jgi:crotonobetainyl-CoA:carnitine CoA-transferase CaiB-like acyl-CoA transferase